MWPCGCSVCGVAIWIFKVISEEHQDVYKRQVLDMTVEEALEFFSNIPKIKQKIQTLYDVGLRLH